MSPPRAILGLLSIALFGACAPAPSDPNVVVVVVDTLRADRLPFMGADEVQAPFLAELASRSVVFERCWSTSSWTAPSTASLFTGVYPNQHGVETGVHVTSKASKWENELRLHQLPRRMETLPEWLGTLGYRTFGVSDNPNISPRLGFERGFGQFTHFDYAGAAKVNEALDGWIDEIRGSAPWFVYLHYMDPHFPYHRRDPWYTEPKAFGVHSDPRARYDSEISYVDKHIREAFEALGVDENTVVIFVSDHGEEFGDHGGIQHKNQLFSELTWIPMFVYHPGVTPRRTRIDANVSILDVLPTLRTILEQDPSDRDEGTSLTEYYLKEQQPASRSLFAMRTHLDYQGANAHVIGRKPGESRVRKIVKRAVVFDDYKYVFTEPNKKPKLFDLAEDPGEINNLAHKRPNIVKDMRARWEKFRDEARTWQGEAVEIDLTSEEMQAFNALGYTGK